MFGRSEDPGPRILSIRRRFRAHMSKQLYIRGSGDNIHGVDKYKNRLARNPKFCCRLHKA